MSDRKGKFSADAASRQALLELSRDHQSSQADRAIEVGGAGKALSQARSASRDPDLKKQLNLVNNEYLLDQGASDSELVIGPIRLSHSVQSIQLAEQRAVVAPKLVRTDRPMVIDGGAAKQEAVIKFLFTGVDEEINSYARALVALFRTCPIVSVDNEMLRSAWAPKESKLLEEAAEKVLESSTTSTRDGKPKIDSAEVRNELYSDLVSAIKENRLTTTYIDKIRKDFSKRGTGVAEEAAQLARHLVEFKQKLQYIPVTMESLSFQTVPDLPETLLCSLLVNRTDVTSATDAGVLEYLGTSPGARSSDPKKAYWLKKFLYEMLTAGDASPNGYDIFLPQITKKDFDTTEFHFFDKPLADLPKLTAHQAPKPIVLNKGSDTTKIAGQSSSLTNHFGHQRLIGKSTTCAHHMGTSARQLSLDIEFATGKEEDTLYEDFNLFKEVSDSLVRTEAIYDRIMGWEVRCVCARILGGSASKIPATRSGVYVPIVTTTETTDIPHLKNTSITMMETNTSFADAFQVVLESGGQSKKDLRDFFLGRLRTTGPGGLVEHLGICPGEEQYRALNIDEKEIADREGDYKSTSWSTFWPVTSGLFGISTSPANISILNRDTIRAALFSPVFDKGAKLAQALRKSPIFSGIIESERSLSFTDNLSLGYNLVGFTTPHIEDERLTNSSSALVDAVDRMFVNQSLTDLSNAFAEQNIDGVNSFMASINESQRLRLQVVNTFLAALAGRPQDLDNLLLTMASNEDLVFSQEYKKALFDILVRRPGRPSGLPHVYDTDGITSGFLELLREYRTNGVSYGFGAPSPTDNTVGANRPNWRHSTYSDFSFLPTYRGLFGQEWLQFAPSFDDLGVQYYRERQLHRPTAGQDLKTIQSLAAVQPDDKVPPYIWFYSRRAKHELHSALDASMEKKGKSYNGVLGSVRKMTLSMNLSNKATRAKYDRLAQDDQALLALVKSKGQVTGATADALEDLIREGYTQNSDFQRDSFHREVDAFDRMISQSTNNETFDNKDLKQHNPYYQFYQTFCAWDNNGKANPQALRLYMTTVARPADDSLDPKLLVGGKVDSYVETSGLFGAALVRVAHERRYEIDKSSRYLASGDPGHPSQDEALTTVGSPTEFAYVRHLDSNMDLSVRSSLAQIPDDHYSPSKMWPTVKVYFVDRRGDDVLLDDLLFSTDSVLSVDVTLDKDDAALAVIKFADPMRLIQDGSIFGRDTLTIGARKTVDGGKEDGQTLVASNRRVGRSNTGGEFDSFLRSKKIEQGRPIMIKMGYDSVASNLETIFTGRIAEMEMGDVVTLVCQGWKAELINRHVNFYTRNKSNWGPKDLAVLAMQLADPDGFGQHYTQEETEKIVQRVGANKEQIDRILNVIQPGTQNVYGADVMFSWLRSADWMVNTFGVADGRIYEGLDTRLKNIWYPDISKNIASFANWKVKLGYLPDYVSTYWLVPIQPAWEVLKEAARHTWNYIVQVVPYDNESTMFFGHPDQLYYYTRGSERKTAEWRKSVKALRTSGLQQIFTDVLYGFIRDEVRPSGLRPTQEDLLHKLSSLGVLSRVSRSTETGGYATTGGVLGYQTVRLDPNSDFLSNLAFSGDRNKRKKTIQPKYSLVESLIVPEAFLRELTQLNTWYDNVDRDELFTPTTEGDLHTVARNKIQNSDYPRQSMTNLASSLGGDPTPLIYSVMFGMDPDRLATFWPRYREDTELLISGNWINVQRTLLANDVRDSGTTLEDLSSRARRIGLGGTQALESLRDQVDQARSVLSGQPTLKVRYTQRDISRSYLQITENGDRLVYDLRILQGIGTSISELPMSTHDSARLHGLYTTLTSNLNVAQQGLSNSVYVVFPADARRNFASSTLRQISLTIQRMIADTSAKSDIETINTDGIELPIYSLPASTSLGDILEEYAPLIKAFVFFLDEYVKRHRSSSANSAKTQPLTYAVEDTTVAPNMRTFRLHHYVSSDRDIIDNSLAVSTAQMWNTVVINHPASDPAEVPDSGSNQVFRPGARVSGSASWVYWPPVAVSKVIGIQFHPGLTVANKKLRVFTELNCNTAPLANRLAMNWLAEGMRKMYIGSLSIRGRVVKPWDRIILDDRYTGMSGPLEVESVVHHFNPDVGWVTTIKPSAVCDSNPGSAAVQTALMEANYKKIYNTGEWFFTALNLLAVGRIASAGLRFTMKGILPAAGKSLFHKGGIAGGAKHLYTLGQTALKTATRQLDGTNKLSPLAVASHVAKTYGLGKVASRLLTNYLLEQTGKTVLHYVGSSAMTQAWMQGHKEPKALPVVLSPMMFNGSPWTAGLEADEALFTVPFYNFYYSLREWSQAFSDAVSTNFFVPDGSSIR